MRGHKGSRISILVRSILAGAVWIAGALPAMAAECGPLKVLASLDLQRLPSGDPAITAAIGDTKETFLVTTGGAVSTLTKRTVADLHLKTMQGTAGVALRGLTGKDSLTEVRLPSITIGSMRQEGAYFYVVGENDPNDKRTPAFAGTIGPDFLKNFDAEFDFAHRKLNLMSKDHCEGKVVYWNAPAVAIVPFRLDASDHIIFPMTLDGKDVTAVLDTGAAHTSLNLNTARRTLNVDTGAPDVEKVGQLKGDYTADTYRKRFSTLSLQGVVTITDPTITLIPDMVTGYGGQRPAGSLIRDTDRGLPDLLLGMPELSKLHIYIAYDEHRLYVTAADVVAAPAPAQAPLARTAMSGSEMRVGSFYFLNPDCSAGDDPVVRVVTPPSHGNIRVAKGQGYTSYPANNQRYACNGKKSPMVSVFYTSEKGYAGSDVVQLGAIFPGGQERTITYDVKVR